MNHPDKSARREEEVDPDRDSVLAASTVQQSDVLSDAALGAELQRLRVELVELRLDYAAVAIRGSGSVRADSRNAPLASGERESLGATLRYWLPRTRAYRQLCQGASRYGGLVASYTGVNPKGQIGIGASDRWKRLQPGIRAAVGDVASLRLVVLVGVILALLGQWLLTSLPDWLNLANDGQGLVRVWPNLGHALVAMALFAIAMALFGLGVSCIHHPKPVIWMDQAAPETGKPHRLTWLCAGFGLLLWTYVIFSLAANEYEPEFARLYCASLALLFFGAIWAERERIRTWRMPSSFRSRTALLLEGAYGLAVVAIFFWLSTFDLAHWRYANIGDEYAFYFFARDIANGADINLFTQAGVYGDHPTLSTYPSGLLMRLLGEDIVAYKTASIVPAALALIFLYALARVLYGRIAAVMTIGFLATAHYLLAIGHTGYGIIAAIFSASAAMLFFALGARHQSAVLLLTSGAFAGLGWYTFYTARPIILVLVLAVILCVHQRSRLATLLPLGVGFILTVSPIVAVSKGDVIRKMLLHSSRQYADQVSPLPLFFRNIGRTLTSFNYSTARNHYMSGSLVEPLTAALFV
ncbi:MAG: glycosyltransferase family 39 protein, partial [Chloroflexota bacterium]|nr:glycosyltransferase family 39 protein [Chloroflexota bacterium]